MVQSNQTRISQKQEYTDGQIVAGGGTGWVLSFEKNPGLLTGVRNDYLEVKVSNSTLIAMIFS